MDSLEPRDLTHLNAAEGWLGLDNAVEASAELEKITPAMRAHPEVLKVRWQICAKAKSWAECVKIAERLVTVAPESAFGWIHRSFALHELKRTKEALEKLLPAADFFPDEITIRYNLACYECVLRNLSRAKIRLAETFKLALNQRCFDQWRSQALDDPDLRTLRGFLEEIEI